MKELSKNAYYLRCRLMIRKNIKEGRGIGNVGDHFFSHSCGFQKEEEGKEKQREDEKLTSKYIDFFYKASQTKSWALYGFNENKI